MNISEANAVNILAAWLYGPPTEGRHHYIPTAGDVREAMLLLVTKANKALGAGWMPHQVPDVEMDRISRIRNEVLVMKAKVSTPEMRDILTGNPAAAGGACAFADQVVKRLDAMVAWKPKEGGA